MADAVDMVDVANTVGVVGTADVADALGAADVVDAMDATDLADAVGCGHGGHVGWGGAVQGAWGYGKGLYANCSHIATKNISFF